MPINAHPEYIASEKEYFAAQTPEEKLKALEKMISLAPGHKGAEKLRAELKTRYKKLKEKLEKGKSQRGTVKSGIKKEDLQAAIIGMTNSGKSSLLERLTNIKTESGEYEFKTRKPVVGMMDYHGTRVQIVEIPAVESEYYDRGIVNNADVILMLITDLNQIEILKKYLEKARGRKLIVFNKTDLLDEKEVRKIFSTMQSRKYDFVMISCRNNRNIPELRDRLFLNFGKIRVYTKEPGKDVKKERPIILEPDSMVEEVARKIFHAPLKQIKEIKIWGPSSKFPGQKVGLKHRLKDLDTVEFRTR
ncbi:MAG: 50S ribosome-binding GTPase [Candidatus Pacearchaeota archaeon]|nr:50S ribosome-binding GTPase [Candidatus Pacearchaeota archaeon]MDE1848570.1 50S ribosome-binding GTPase [Nanoarchaeota archaeon]